MWTCTASVDFKVSKICKFLFHFTTQASVKGFSKHEEASIQKLCQHGQLDLALVSLSDISKQGISASGDVFFAFLQSCHRRIDLVHVNRLYIHIALHGLDASYFLFDYLVSTLASCEGTEAALRLFHKSRHRSVYSWTSLISCSIDHEKYEDALRLYQYMLGEGIESDAHTLVYLIKACSNMSNLKDGMILHHDAHLKGLTSDGFIASALINMYGKSCYTIEAENVFNGSPKSDSVVWNALLSAFSDQCDIQKVLQIYGKMQSANVTPNKQTYLVILRGCSVALDKVQSNRHLMKSLALEAGRVLHGEAEKKGFTSDVFVGSTLVSMYGKLGSIPDAEKLFTMLSWHDVVSASVMLSACLEGGNPEDVLQLYKSMKDIDEQILILALQAVCMLAGKDDSDGKLQKSALLEICQALHAVGRNEGFIKDIFLGSVLINTYGKLGRIAEAENVFVSFVQKDAALFNSILSAYVEQGQPDRALQLYLKMQQEGILPHDRIFVTTLQACSVVAEKEEPIYDSGNLRKPVAQTLGQALHADIRQMGFDSDVFVCNTLITMYGACLDIKEAENVFNGILIPDAVSWNAMLSAYMQQGEVEKVIQLHKQMCEKSAVIDDTTFYYILQACSETGSLQILRLIHHGIVLGAYDGFSLLAMTLIRAYTTCVSMKDAQAVFDKLDAPDVATWSSLIAGYAYQGDHGSSFLKFNQMQKAGIKPNEDTHLAVLSACNHANLVETGFNCLKSMIKDHDLSPTIEHYNCILDLLGRAGDFLKINDVLSMMLVKPDFVTWLCLLSSCLKHGNVEFGENCFKNAVKLNPEHSGAYVLMANIYTNSGLMDRANELHALMQKHVHSWIEPENEVSILTWCRSIKSEAPV